MRNITIILSFSLISSMVVVGCATQVPKKIDVDKRSPSSALAESAQQRFARVKAGADEGVKQEEANALQNYETSTSKSDGRIVFLKRVMPAVKAALPDALRSAQIRDIAVTDLNGNCTGTVYFNLGQTITCRADATTSRLCDEDEHSLVCLDEQTSSYVVNRHDFKTHLD